MLRRNQTYERFTEKRDLKKNYEKFRKHTKKLGKMYDSLLADVGKHQTYMQ